MNFLAHTLFAQVPSVQRPGAIIVDSELVVGQYCGDFVRTEIAHFPTTVQHGIHMHRAIDSFTDAHAQNLQARRLFTKPLRRFAGVIVDVAYDHFLARHWQQFSDLPLEQHAGAVYAALREHEALLPAQLQRFSQRVIAGQVLTSYRDFAAVGRTLAQISQRSPRFTALADTDTQLQAARAELEECFLAFFPELVTHMASQSSESHNRSPVSHGQDHRL